MSISTLIERCNHFLEIAEDRNDLDAFNYWYAERERLKREKKNEHENIDELIGGYKL